MMDITKRIGQLLEAKDITPRDTRKLKGLPEKDHKYTRDAEKRMQDRMPTKNMHDFNASDKVRNFAKTKGFDFDALARAGFEINKVLDNSWVNISDNRYNYQLMVFDTPSDYGVFGDSKVSKMHVKKLSDKGWNNPPIPGYDRGWDTEDEEEPIGPKDLLNRMKKLVKIIG